MKHPLTIVTYHYVRDLEHSDYPDIKGLPLEDFKEQMAFISKHYRVIGAKELMVALQENEPLPPRSLLLTFDDGYSDHYRNVLPILERKGIKACFFPPAGCVLEKKVLTVNKIHFVLAAADGPDELVDNLLERIRQEQGEWDLESPERYWERLGKSGRWDPPEVIFCKRLLQRELPRELRQRWTDELFRQYVTGDEAAFSEELYMNREELAELRKRGMYVGSHGYDHYWMNELEPNQQSEELDRSLTFLSGLGVNTDRWIMCYPYGAYDDSLKKLLKKRNCVAAFTTEQGLARPGKQDPLAFPRIDTNDLPKQAEAEPGEWTRAATGVSN